MVGSWKTKQGFQQQNKSELGHLLQMRYVITRKMSGDSELGFTEHLFKILVIGDYKVGKTSFVKRYVRNQFYEELKTTIGVDFSMKVIDWNSHTRVRLQLWDIAGKSYFKREISLIELSFICLHLICHNRSSMHKTE